MHRVHLWGVSRMREHVHQQPADVIQQHHVQPEQRDRQRDAAGANELSESPGVSAVPDGGREVESVSA